MQSPKLNQIFFFLFLQLIRYFRKIILSWPSVQSHQINQNQTMNLLLFKLSI